MGSSHAADSMTVALDRPVDLEYAPWPRNSSERLVFGHLYETLITVDCLGEVRPGIARAWKKGQGGRRWTFELRDDVRFWDGTKVTASDVVWSWELAAMDPRSPAAIIDSTVVKDERLLHVFLKQRYGNVPRVFADLSLAVARSGEGAGGLLGTGSYRPAGSDGVSLGELVTVRPAFGGDTPVIQFIGTPGEDVRDALEAGCDLAVTRDPAVVEYALHQPQLVAAALPWDRTYVLLIPDRRADSRGRTESPISPGFRDRLARDAVRGDARGAESPLWWNDLDECDEPEAPRGVVVGEPPDISDMPAVRDIVYSSADPVARDLAERIVALATPDSDRSPDAKAVRAVLFGASAEPRAVTAKELGQLMMARRLRAGSDLAFVISIPRRPSDLCFEAQKLRDRIPWLGVVGKPDGALIPLVDTRRHAIARRDGLGIHFDWFGRLFISDMASRGR